MKYTVIYSVEVSVEAETKADAEEKAAAKLANIAINEIGVSYDFDEPVDTIPEDEDGDQLN